MKILFLFINSLIFILVTSNTHFWKGQYCSGALCQCPKNDLDCCETDKISMHVSENLYDELKDITEQSYFRYYKINLLCECRFWHTELKCSIRNCAVDTCSQDELPEAFRINGINHEEVVCAEGPLVGLDHIDKTKNNNFTEYYNDDPKNDKTDDTGAFCDSGDNLPETEFVDLILNPERFTGYSGQSANKIWTSIYKENCFKNVEEKCIEFEIFQKLISGMHASVNLHLVSLYPTNSQNETIWGVNIEMFKQRFSPKNTNNQSIEWFKNLYILASAMIRAIIKAEHLWEKMQFYTGDNKVDEITKTKVLKFVSLLKDFPCKFKEQVLFDDHSEEIRLKFLNITRIMDCVGCEKCRLWGKLQTQGIGTALKILYTKEQQLLLTRNEIVSLFNAAFRYITSLNNLNIYKNILINQENLEAKVKNDEL